MDALVEFILRNKNIILGGLIGLVLAILFITIGFWKTILVVIFVVLGALIGGFPIIRKKISEFFSKLFSGGSK